MASRKARVDAKPGGEEPVARFGRFKVDLAEALSRETVNKLAHCFEYSPAVRDMINDERSPGMFMVDHMEERGQIQSTDITPLLHALNALGLHGTETSVRNLAETHVRHGGQFNQPMGAKKRAFIEQLKIAYERECDTIKPVPFIKDKMYNVDSLYVDGGMQVLVGKGGTENTNVWQQLHSYTEILRTPNSKLKRKVIEGDPGYGKSTLTLQYLNDWCKKNPESPLKDVEILIYLKLRQMKGISSIYKAIKLFVLPNDTRITELDIEHIIQGCKSVVIFFDGYDEYPDKNRRDTDFSSIIGMQMLQDIVVVLTTRTTILPPELGPQTERFKLTGFGKDARRNYIKQVVAPNDDLVADKIENHLRENPVVDALCESPLFYTMVAHISHEMKSREIFSSATRFIHFLMTCFHTHTRNKGGYLSADKCRKFEMEHGLLDRIAFEGLCGKDQNLLWDKSLVVDMLGLEFYNYYVSIGMLVEEAVLDISRRSDGSEFIRTKAVVRFPHKIFCEWYAGNRMASLMGSSSEAATNASVDDILSNIDPFDLQYVYRFACGLNKVAAESIIRYLQKTKEGSQFAILCMLEQEDKSAKFLQRVKELVTNETPTIHKQHTKLQQRSTIQVLEIASANQIPISDLELVFSFRGCDGHNITLESGHFISILSSIEKISINADTDQALSEEEVTGLIHYGLNSPRFKELWFFNCELPSWIDPCIIPDESKTRNVKVISSNEACFLHLDSGKWKKPNDIHTIKVMCSNGVAISQTSSEPVQKSAIALLVKASNHDIPINQVSLLLCFSKIDEDGNIILHSGLSLPILPSLERLAIQTETGREMNQEEVTGILNYVQQSQRFKELELSDCLLPASIVIGSPQSTLRSRNMKVSWEPFNMEQQYLSDFSSRPWMKEGSFVKLTDEEYRKTVNRFRELWRDWPWQKKRQHLQQLDDTLDQYNDHSLYGCY